MNLQNKRMSTANCVWMSAGQGRFPAWVGMENGTRQRARGGHDSIPTGT